MARWDETQPVFDGMKVPEWAMVDPFQDIAKQMIVQEQHQAQMREAALTEQRQQMAIDAGLKQQQMQQGVADYVRSNPNATPDQVYKTVQQSALAGGDVGTWLKIAEQMHEQNMMQERARREQERQAVSANNSALTTMARLQGINPQDPQAAYNYARAMGLTDEFGITPDSLRRPEKERKGGGQKAPSYKPYAMYDPTTKQNITVNVGDPNVQARIDAGLLLPKKSESEIQMMELMSKPKKEEGPGLFSRLGAWWNGEGRQSAQTAQEPQGRESLAAAKALLAGQQNGQPVAGRRLMKKKVNEQ